MQLIDLFALISFVFGVLCGIGVALIREIMLDEVQRRLPEGEKIRFPHLSYKYFEIVRLHAQFYPESRIRAVARFLIYAGAFAMGSIALIMLWSVARNSAVGR